MNRRSTRGILLAVTLLFGIVSRTVTAFAEGDRAETILTTASGIAALVAQDTRFEPRLQLRTGLEAGLLVSWPEQTGTAAPDAATPDGATPDATGTPAQLELGVGMQIVRVVATPAVSGYSYPGWIGRAGWVSAQYRPSADSRFGFRLKASGLFATFDSTFLLTFFPVLELAPLIFIQLPGRTEAVIQLSAGWELRRDLTIVLGPDAALRGSVFGGVSLGLRRTLPRLQ